MCSKLRNNQGNTKGLSRKAYSSPSIKLVSSLCFEFVLVIFAITNYSEGSNRMRFQLLPVRILPPRGRSGCLSFHLFQNHNGMKILGPHKQEFQRRNVKTKQVWPFYISNKKRRASYGQNSETTRKI